MEKENRKVNLVGQNTLTISLPSKFVKENKIEKGCQLSCEYEGKEIKFSLNEFKKQEKSISINIDNYDFLSLSKYITMLYISNYNRIILNYTNSKIDYYKSDSEKNIKNVINQIINRLIGAEVISQTSTKTEIECFLHNDPTELQKVEKRVYFLFKESANELIHYMKNDFIEFQKEVYVHHDNIVKFIYYLLRMIDSSNISEYEKKQAYSFFMTIDLLVDKFRHIADEIVKHKYSEKLEKILKEIFDLFFETYSYTFKTKITKEIILKRYTLINKIEKENFTKEELKVLSHADLFLNIINETSFYLLSKEM